MLVKEIIEKLSKLDQEKEMMFIFYNDWGEHLSNINYILKSDQYDFSDDKDCYFFSDTEHETKEYLEQKENELKERAKNGDEVAIQIIKRRERVAKMYLPLVEKSLKMPILTNYNR